MKKIFRAEDASLDDLAGRRTGIIGYGNLGRPFALNLRDSGLDVMLSERDSERQALARREGFRPVPLPDLVRSADLIFLLLPDELMQTIFLRDISPWLARGDMLIFASASNIAFGFIEPPPMVDVGLLAPRTLAVAVRERYLAGRGFFSFLAVHQDTSGRAWRSLLALARAIGSLHADAGGIEISFAREAELDLFMQQAVMPVLQYALQTAGQVLIDHGYPPEAAFIDLYLSGELEDLLHRAGREGLFPALRTMSLTSQYGLFSRLERFQDNRLATLMGLTLEDIRSGTFARDWAREQQDGFPRLLRLLRKHAGMELWQLEQEALDLIYPERERDTGAFDVRPRG